MRKWHNDGFISIFFYDIKRCFFCSFNYNIYKNVLDIKKYIIKHIIISCTFSSQKMYIRESFFQFYFYENILLII